MQAALKHVIIAAFLQYRLMEQVSNKTPINIPGEN